jgi:SPP1 gp7 family putative phage head morphogenesis protein
MYGNGAIRALATDLKTDKLAAELAANSAKHGRPTAVFSPADSDDVWSETQIKRLRAAYEKTTRSSGGALFLGSGAKMDPMSWSPRDLEFSKVREGVREAILAVFDVPPTRLGGNSANYATSKEQAKRYFEGLKGRSAIIDGELSRVAKMFPGWENSDVRVYHDFSGVDALAESRDARVGRVRSWSDMGIPLADAAAFEGFDDLPGQDVDEDVVSTGDGPATMGQPMAATALNGAQVASLLSIIGQVSGGLLTLDAAVALIGSAFPTVSEAQARRIVSGAMSPPPEPTPAAVKTAPVFVNRSASFDERSSAWDAFIEKSHGPAEHSIERALKAYMSEAAARTATRLKTELKKTAAPFVTRSEHEDVDIDSATLARVLDEVHEAELLEAAVAGPMKAAFSDAAVAAVKTLPSEWTAALAPVRTDEAALARIGQLVKDVQPYTADAVRDVMVKGLSEGASIADMQAAIQTSRGYTPARALRIATTEATTAVNAGTVEAYTAIADAGFPIKYEWISAKDKVVRDEHRQLDQHPPIAPGELFKIGDHSAPSPGQFASASMNVNCRCALLPVIDED